MKKTFIPLLLSFIFFFNCFSQQKTTNKNINVIAYYAGRETMLDSFPLEKLTHLIFCFTHLKGNEININNKRDTATLEKMVSLKKTKYPNLKIQISLGGWGGCATCSDAFQTEEARKEFAASVKKLLNYFDADGLDLDWEYPTIPGPPGHAYSLKDKDNFTDLVKILRKKLGRKKEISFAAGGFSRYIDESIDWDQTMKYVDRVNIMSYDLVSGYATKTGHHTGLYSTPQQKQSTDNAVQLLLQKKVSSKKLVIGAAFYARVFEKVDSTNNGLYQIGNYKNGASYRNFNTYFSTDSGFVMHWDPVAQAPFAYNPAKKLFGTFDDSTSVSLKTKYAIENGLGGIMFWQLADDSFFKGGLLDVIDETKKDYK